MAHASRISRTGNRNIYVYIHLEYTQITVTLHTGNNKYVDFIAKLVEAKCYNLGDRGSSPDEVITFLQFI
jgi:hypothetical protein